MAHRGVAERDAAHACGLVINLGGKTVYHLGDTGLFSDLALRASATDRRRAHVHRRPLHDGSPRRRDRRGARGAGTVIPCHYDTFPPIETDAEAFKSDVESKTSSKVAVLQPGETFSA